MTSARQMSSRRPPVCQSTFGLPDDPNRSADFSPQPTPSVHRLSVGVLTPPAHLPSSRPLRPARLGTLQKMREAPFFPTLCPPCLGWLLLPTLQNVEKLSRKARIRAISCETKKISTSPKFNNFPCLDTPFRRLAQLPGHLLPSRPFCPFCPLRPLREALFSPALCLRELCGSQSGSLKNVEKLSFQARLNCLYRQLEIFFTAPKCNFFQHRIAPIRRFAEFPFRLSTSPPLRPARLGTLQEMREAFSSPVLCLRELFGRQSPSRKNVEKLSFGPHRLACTSRRKKYFHPVFQHFPARKLSHCLTARFAHVAPFRAHCAHAVNHSPSVRSVSSLPSVSFLSNCRISSYIIAAASLRSSGQKKLSRAGFSGNFAANPTKRGPASGAAARCEREFER